MNKVLYVLIVLFLASCTSNTIYEKPENLIPRDTMVAFLTDMYVASSAKNVKNKFLKKESNYVFLIYEKYKIDTTRFHESNIYYTSKADEYSEILKKVKKNIDSLSAIYREAKRTKDSLNRPASVKFEKSKKNKKDSLKKKPLLKSPKIEGIDNKR